MNMKGVRLHELENPSFWYTFSASRPLQIVNGRHLARAFSFMQGTP